MPRGESLAASERSWIVHVVPRRRRKHIRALAVCVCTALALLVAFTGYAFAVPFRLDGEAFYQGGNPSDLLSGSPGASPDTGFVRLTNSGSSKFVGTIGFNAISGGGTSFSSSYPVTLGAGEHVSIALNNEGSNYCGYNGTCNEVGKRQKGAQFFVDGTVSLAGESEHVAGSIYDRDIHSGSPRTNPFGVTLDDYILQGGDPYGRDTGDGYEDSQAPGLFQFVQKVPAPVSTAAPVIENGEQPQQGETLNAQPGTWLNNPTSFTREWVRCNREGAECAEITGAKALNYTPVMEDVGSTLRIRENAKNAGGTTSILSAATGVVQGAVPYPTCAPKISGVARAGEILTLTHACWQNQPSGYSEQWKRCDTAGENCSAIGHAVNLTYQVQEEDVGATLELEERATNTAGTSAPSVSATTPPVSRPELVAAAGEEVHATEGVAVTMDGSGSSPAAEIDRYRWEYGDGTSSESGTPAESHVYAHEGAYTATLTVFRKALGSSEQEEAHNSVKVAVASASAAGVTITVESASHQPLAGVTVLYVGADGSRSQAATDGSGTTPLAGLPDGVDTLYLYKSGFIATTAQVTVAGGAGHATVTLNEGQTVASTLSSHEMTPAEMEKAGINPNDPANQQVYDFEARLAFTGSQTPGSQPHCHINSAGEFLGHCVQSNSEGGETRSLPCTPFACYGGGGGGGGGSGPAYVIIPRMIEGHPLLQWLILRGTTTLLKQFTELNMVIENLSAEPVKAEHPLTLEQGVATLDLPAGISLAPTAAKQTLSQEVANVPAMGSATVTWILRGDVPGEYHLAAAYHGVLEPVGAAVETAAALAQPLHVWGANALKLTLEADRARLAIGMPYHIRLGVRNEADIPLYNVSLAVDPKAHASFIFQPQQSYSQAIAVLKPGETLHSPEYIVVPEQASEEQFNPALSSVTFAGQTAAPGSGITALPPPRAAARLAAPPDSENQVHLEWEPVPHAEGYEIFATPSLAIPFAPAPETVLFGPAGTPMTRLPAAARDAFIPANGSEQERYYAVSTIINGTPTLVHEVIAAKPSSEPSRYPEVKIDAHEVNCSTKAGTLQLTVEDQWAFLKTSGALDVTGLEGPGTTEVPLTNNTGTLTLKPSDPIWEPGEAFYLQAHDIVRDGRVVTVKGLCPQGGVVAFGDSVAAGYGLGASEGYPDNENAYSALWARELGVEHADYGVEGTTAPAALAQIKQVPEGAAPKVVTVQDGANDINFASCIVYLFTHGDITLEGGGDECNKAKLQPHLQQLETNLVNVISTIHSDQKQQLQGAEIDVAQYYNPLAPPPGASEIPCAISDVVEAEHLGVKGIVSVVATKGLNGFLIEAEQAQKLLYEAGERVLGGVNAAILKAVETERAAGVNVRVIPESVAGHDMCAPGGNEWVFAPVVDFELEEHGLFHVFTASLLGQQICPAPSSGEDYNFKVGLPAKLPFGLELALRAGVNCLPHPTLAGQEAIARAFASG